MKKHIIKILSCFLVLLLIAQTMSLNPVFAEDISNFLNSSDTNNGFTDEIAESYIIGEAEEYRTRYNKTFRRTDGTFTIGIYPEPVHYLDGSVWKEIDNTLAEICDNNGNIISYNTIKTDLPVSFPCSFSSDSSANITAADSIIKFTPSGEIADNTAKTVSIDKLTLNKLTGGNLRAEKDSDSEAMRVDLHNSGIIYKGVYDGVDLEYEITSNTIKEGIVINKPIEDYTFSFDIDFGDLTPKMLFGNVIGLYKDGSTEPDTVMTTQFMIDSDGNESKNIEIQLAENEGGYTVTIIPEKEWISSPERSFPIVIDPSFVLDVGASNITDTYVDTGAPNAYHAADYWIYSGMNSLGKTRAYVKFSLPNLPNCGVITNAVLHLAQADYDPGNGTNCFINVYNVTSSWTESSITWSNQPSVSSYATDYTDFHSGIGEYNYSFNITTIVKNWYENGSNYGFMLKSSNESVTKRSRFYSSNYNGSNGYALIALTYVDNTGIEDYWSFETVDLGKSGMVYINDYNGALTYVHDDISIAGNLMPLSIQHTFNSVSAASETSFGGGSKFGKGFRTSFCEKITVLTDSTLTGAGYGYMLKDSDGTVFYFKSTGTSGTYAYEFDSNIVLTVPNESTYKYLISYEDGSKRYYTSDGYLLYIKDCNGNTYTISKTDSKATKITDSNSLSATLTYSSSTNRLTKITDPSGRNTTYTYSSGNLTKITYPGNKTTEFEYDDNGQISRIKAFDDTDIVITYKAVTCLSKTFYRVYTVAKRSKADSDGNRETLNTLTFAYSTAATTVTDENSNKNIIYFDNAGRAISVKDQSINLATASYNKTGNKNNTLAYSSDAFKFTDNLLLNHSFENGLTNWDTYYSGGTYEVSAVTSQHYIGSKALMLKLTTEGGVLSNQDYTGVSTGSTYTVSAYCKVSSVSSGRVGILVEMKTGDTILSTANSPEIKHTNAEWEKIQVSFTIPADCTYIRIFPYAYASTVTAYFDCFQLEKAGAAGRYNLLSNPGLHDTAGEPSLNSWTASSGVTASSATSIATGAKFSGSQTSVRTLSQTITIGTSSTSRTAVFGTLAKGYCSASCSDSDNSRFFGIKVELYTDSTAGTTKSAEFNSNAQYAVQNISSSITIPTTVNKLKITLMYNYEINTAYFDSVFVYLDNYGTAYSYNSDGKLIQESNNAGEKVKYTYTGPDISTVKYYKNDVEQDSVTYTYTNHNIRNATYRDGKMLVYTYPESNKGLPLRITLRDADYTLKTTKTYTYDPTYNNLLTETDARGKTTTYTYYETKGLVKSVKDASSKLTSYAYNSNTDELISVSGGSSSTTLATANYAYNSFGSIASITRNGFSYNFEYDTFGRPVKTKVGSQALCTYAYNADGTLFSETYGNGNTHKYYYDSLDRVTSEYYNGTKAFSYSYGTDGALGSYYDYSNSIGASYSYDLSGRVTDVDYTDNTRMDYRYNDKGNLRTFQATRNGTVLSRSVYTYNNDGLPSTLKMTNTAYPNAEYTYDSINRLTSYEHTVNGDVVSTNYSYISGTSPYTSTLVGGITYRYDGYDFGPHNDIDYTYTGNGNIKTITENGYVISYLYDNLNRLNRENNQLRDETIIYTYDEGGNILSKKYYPYTEYGTDISGRPRDTVVYTYDSTWKDKLLTYTDGNTITYDAIGNPLSYNGKNFTWQRGRQLKTVNTGSGSYTYKYDVNGQRISKTTGSTTMSYIYASGLLMRAYDGTLNMKFSYDANGVPRSVKYKNGSAAAVDYYYLYNLQGDVISLYNSGGNPVVNYTYDSWGKVLSITGSLATTLGKNNPIRYRGYYYDNETGFYYLNSRYYDPETGRFINADNSELLNASPTGLANKNLFIYCENNPVIAKDSDGEYFHLIVGAVAGGLIGGISAGLSGEDAVGVLISTLGGAVSGLLAASGVGIVGQIIGGTVISAGTTFAKQTTNIMVGDSDSYCVKEIAIDGAIGAISGILGGKGASYGSSTSINSSGKQLLRKVVNGNNIKKAAAYYYKTAHVYGKQFVLKKLVRPTVISSVVNAISVFKTVSRRYKQ